MSTKTCPYCAEEILAAAIKCKHCGSELAELPARGTSQAAADSANREHGALAELQARVKVLENRLPTTKLLSSRFWERALAVWGHYLSIMLLIYAAVIFAAIVLGGIAALVSPPR